MQYMTHLEDNPYQLQEYGVGWRPATTKSDGIWFLQSYQLWRPLFATRDWCRISRIPEQSVCWRHLFRCQCGGVSCRRLGGLANGACLSWIALAEEEAYVDRPGGVCVLYDGGV